MTLQLLTLPEVHEAVAKFAKRAPRTVRTIAEMKPGETLFTSPWIRQGDIYVVAIKAVLKGWPVTKNRQLAPGLSLGSRHVVEGNVDVFAPPTPDTRAQQQEVGGRVQTAIVTRRFWGFSILLGPQLVAADRFTITHPRHAHFSLPAGVYQVAYQTDPNTQVRVKD